jgi:hypothetical protein
MPHMKCHGLHACGGLQASPTTRLGLLQRPIVFLPSKDPIIIGLSCLAATLAKHHPRWKTHRRHHHHQSVMRPRGRKAYQRGGDGACRGMILSLLVDYFLLTHPAQIRQSRAGLPLWTAGSVVRRLQYDNMLSTIEDIFTSSDPLKALESSAETKIPRTASFISSEECSRLEVDRGWADQRFSSYLIEVHPISLPAKPFLNR